MKSLLFFGLRPQFSEGLHRRYLMLRPRIRFGGSTCDQIYSFCDHAIHNQIWSLLEQANVNNRMGFKQ